MSIKWKLSEREQIWDAKINGNEYEVYQTEPGMQRVMRNGQVIVEVYTTEEAKRWAETYDKWLEQEGGKVVRKPASEPKMIGEILKEMGLNWKRFPRGPEEFV